MTPEQLDALIDALQSQRQLDADGCMVAVSRQACNEAADMISYFRAALAASEAARAEAGAGAYEAAVVAKPALGWEAYVVDDAPSYLSDWQRGLAAGQHAMVKAIRALPPADAMAALEARDKRVREEARKVKPLVWFEVEKSRLGGKYTADGYTIRYIEGLWLLDFAGDSKSVWRFSTLDAAKSAAQADYEARILSALIGEAGQ